MPAIVVTPSGARVPSTNDTARGIRSSTARPSGGMVVLGAVDIWIGWASSPTPRSASSTDAAVVQIRRSDGPSTRVSARAFAKITRSPSASSVPSAGSTRSWGTAATPAEASAPATSPAKVWTMRSWPSTVTTTVLSAATAVALPATRIVNTTTTAARTRVRPRRGGATGSRAGTAAKHSVGRSWTSSGTTGIRCVSQSSRFSSSPSRSSPGTSTSGRRYRGAPTARGPHASHAPVPPCGGCAGRRRPRGFQTSSGPGQERGHGGRSRVTGERPDHRSRPAGERSHPGLAMTER